MDLRETECEVVDWTLLTQDRDQWRALLNTNKSSGFIKGEKFDFLTGC